MSDLSHAANAFAKLRAAVVGGETHATLDRDEAEAIIDEIIKSDGQAVVDEAALDRLNVLLSAAEWPGASGLEDVAVIVRGTGRTEVPDAPPWSRH